MTDPTQTAAALSQHAQVAGKPVLASWMGGAGVSEGAEILNRAGIPTFEFPDEAARTFCQQVWRAGGTAATGRALILGTCRGCAR